jgi:hypothetical protein
MDAARRRLFACAIGALIAVGANAAPAWAIPPNPPPQPSVTAGNGSITVSFFAPPGNGSPPVTGYTASCTSSDGGTPNSNTLPGAVPAPITVTGLSNGNAYTCTVNATNSDGPSVDSIASAQVSPSPTAPDAPTQPTITRGNAQITVTFAAPPENGSTITGYDASCASSDGGSPNSAGLSGSAATPITVTGLTNGHVYSCTVTATNGVGTSSPSASSATTLVADVPNQPAAPTLVAGNAQLIVSFVAPVANGSAITGFSTACTDGLVPVTNTGTTSPITITGLTNGHTYTCNVTATNLAGTSLASPDSLPAIPATVPGQPAAPTLVAGDTQLVVTFAPPTDNGSAITSFSTTCTDGVAPVTNTGTTSPITVTGLTNGHTYTCTVTATNAAGPGAPSLASLPAAPATVPGTPAQPAVAGGNAQIVVTFVPPAANGSAITGYNATCTDGTTPVSAGGTTSPITVTGLTNGHSYTCTVTATNLAGPSLPSPASAPLVIGLPDAPAQPAVAVGSTQLTLTFAAPADHGVAITGYTATCTSNDGGVLGTVSGPASALTLAVSGLTNGKTYTCTVTATNAAGSSAPSPATAAAIPAGTPSAPGVPAVTAGNERIAVAFSAPAGNGGAITGYTATCTSANSGISHSTSGSGSPLTVTNLFNGEAYSCTVTATNAAGTSAPSPVSPRAVPATVPAAPTIGGAAAGTADITVSFTPNGDNGSPITGYSATCTSSNGGITRSMSGAGSPITVTNLTNGNSYTCTVSATNAVGPSVGSASSPGLIVGSPGAPTIVSVVSGPAPTSKGSLKVSVLAGPSNGDSILSYRVTCKPTSSGTARFKTSATSPILVAGLLTGHTYSCMAVATNFFGVSAASNAMVGTVGTPGLPRVVKVLKVAHGIAVLVSPPAANGHPITDYRARCTSADGGAPSSPTKATSPIMVNRLSVGKTYTCMVTAINSRGASPPTKIGPVVITAVNAQSVTTCSGHHGSVHATPGLLLTLPVANSFTLGATFGSCSGPYVQAAGIAVSFRTKSALSCQSVIGARIEGSGTFTWRAPIGLGTSGASIHFVLGTTVRHTTTAHFSGSVTSHASVFSGAHVTGTLILQRGLHAAASGGDCTPSKWLGSFSVTSAGMTIS